MRPDKIVTRERELRTVEEITAVYRERGIRVECEERSVPVHDLIATQNAIEAEKLDLVRGLVAEGKLDVPIIVEEHFIGEDYRRYVIDGHCRARAGIELGRRFIAAFVLWARAGDFSSNFVSIAGQYGNLLVRELGLY